MESGSDSPIQRRSYRRGCKRRRTRTNRSDAERRRSCRLKNTPKICISSDNSSSSCSTQRSRNQISSSSSDSDNEIQCAKRSRTKSVTSKFDELLKTPNAVKGKRRIADEIQPLQIDSTFSFQSVGGLASHVQKLKEMVIFPMLYKEYFTDRGIQPPRGVLFHGPPGTGKTLLAKALASEVSAIGGRKVSIFLRKGADVLNKWIGESERHLKLLFQQASLMQPSIIFFDEIDGLAPMRSSKTDQIHNSIVATLLAEMDGLKDRGDVIVIGATNRLDTLDPALRRAGRFDFELQFSLPSYKERKEIFAINFVKWKPSISSELLDELATMTVGYSGADIKSLCSEASFCALRRRYPQIYKANHKFILDFNSIKVERCDWENAMKAVGNTTERFVFSSVFTPLPLPNYLQPLLSRAVEELHEEIVKIFPPSTRIRMEPSGKSLLVEYGVNHDVLEHIISAGLLKVAEGLPVHLLTMQTLASKSLDDGGSSGLALFFAELKRTNRPSVVYIPYMDHLYDSISQSGQFLLQQELCKLFYHPILVIAFCENQTLPDELIQHFKNIQFSPISTKERCDFFRTIFSHALHVKVHPAPVVEEQLALAPMEPARLNPEILVHTEKAERRVMRELRIFLREITFKLLRSKKFAEFAHPVDPNEVPDYLEVISHPMDLETMLQKVTDGKYHSAAEFLADIKLIKENCLNYNPTKTNEDRQIRHRAHELKDVATSYIEIEMDTDFEDLCQDIVKRRKERCALLNGASNEISDGNGKSNIQLTDDSAMDTDHHVQEPICSSTKRSRRRSAWSRGKLKTTPKRRLSQSSTNGGSNGVSTTTPTKSKIEDVRQAKISSKSRFESQEATPPTSLSLNNSGNHKSLSESELEMDVKAPINEQVCADDHLPSSGGNPGEMRLVPDSEGCAACLLPQHRECKNKTKVVYEQMIRSTYNFTIRKLLELRIKLLKLVEEHPNPEDKIELVKKLQELSNSIVTSSNTNPLAFHPPLQQKLAQSTIENGNIVRSKVLLKKQNI